MAGLNDQVQGELDPACLLWVILDRASRSLLSFDVRFAPIATDRYAAREMSRRAKLGSICPRFLTPFATLRGISLLGGGKVLLWENCDASET